MLAWAETVIDAAGVAPILERRMPTGGRPRQLQARTLLVGMLLSQADGRPAHHTRVHDALVALAPADQRRLGVVAHWRTGPHALTYRQVERTTGLVVGVLDNPDADGTPSALLAAITDALIEASVPERYKHASSSLAVDWTDHETWARPPGAGAPSADTDASWGHRAGDQPGQHKEVFYGYFPQAATMVADEDTTPVPELARRLLVTSCHVDPVRAMVPVLARLRAAGTAIGDVIGDSGYAHRAATAWALPVRRLGGRLIQDLHPSDRGPKGTHNGAIIANGNLFCPCTPRPLLDIGPIARGANDKQTAAHDRQIDELARYKLGPITAHDADGYHRVQCPAAAGKLRCPLQAASMALGYDRPEILAPPQHPPACCTQQTITVPPSVNAKTAQKHDYPGPKWRRSYARRTAAERTYATTKDPARNDAGRRGWCRLTGLTAITLFLTALYIARNDRIVAAFEARIADDARRAAKGQPPRTRRRRRHAIDDLIDTG